MQRRENMHNNFLSFHINTRSTKGLEQPSSKFFYGNALRYEDSWVLAHRPLSCAFIEDMKTDETIDTETPRLILNVYNGVSIRDARTSRYNLYNVVATLRFLRNTLKRGSFKAEDVCIMSPYRAQASLCRRTLL